MPITRRQFELGIDNDIEKWMRDLSSFVEGRKSEAFSESELRDALKVAEGPLYGNERRQKDRLFTAALQRLVELGVVSEREVLEVTYYAMGRNALNDVLKP